jgi:tripartite-type tricarboxylate transporter receptor subunit TctC
MTDKTKRTGLNRRQLLGTAAAATGAMVLTIDTKGAFAQSYPDRPITIVVMYAAGGGTDTVMRKIADEMAKAKGWDINVINKPGAVGSVATQYVASQEADGYTILGGSNFNKFGRVMGHIDGKPWEDWVFFHASNSFASWSVRADSPYLSFQDVVDAAKAAPGKLSISTSGTGGIWHELALIVADFAGIELKFVPYKGGKPATLAGLQGEVDIAGGGVHEHVDLVRAGELRPLQQTSAADIVLDNGQIVWPSIGSLISDIKPFLPIGGTSDFIMSRDTPPEVLEAVKEAFVAAVNSPGFKEMADSKYFQLDVKTGEEADKMAAQFETITVDIFNKYSDQIGQDVKSADELGLPSPADFDKWWPPEGYKAPSV